MFDECFRDICRICVERSEDYIRIYDKVIPDNTPFFYIINDVCQLDICENDGFPEYICKDCFLKISEFMIFKRKSHDAKLNFLSMKISLSEAANLNDVNLEKGTMMATNILVKEMTPEGVTLNVAHPDDIIEEVITVPYLVDYEEVVTDDTYTLDEDQTYVAETENVLSQSPPSPAPLVDRKRNSKEREVAIILADGGRTLLPKEKGNEVIVTEDTGQEVREKADAEEYEESSVSLRRSFVAQAYYRSYLLEKERREGEKVSEAVTKVSTSPAPDAVGNGGDVNVEEVLEFNVASEKVDLPEQETEASQEEIPVPIEILPTVVEENGVKELEVVEPELATAVQEVVESQICEEGPPKAVCCKKKMLAISKSLELSRSLELSEKKIKPETFVVESDLDVLVEACRSREVSWNSTVDKTPVESVELPVEADGQPLETEIVNDAVVSDGEEDSGVMGGTDQVNTHVIRQVRAQKVSCKATLKSARGDRRGVSQGPRFRIPCSEPAPPPKRRKKEVTKQGMKFIQVIASEELRAKRQQLDLMDVEDILKKNFSGKKTIQVSEVGPSGKVFHVEPTIVKLRGIPLTPGQMIRSNSTPSTETAVKNGSTNLPWRQRDDEEENGGGDRVVVVPGISPHSDSKGCENGGEEKQDKGCTEVTNGEVTISSGSPISIDILGSDDGTPKTLLLTAPKEENSSTQALAILLRPLKQEEEVEDPLEAVEHSVRTKSLQQILGDQHEDNPEQPMTILVDPHTAKRELKEEERPAEEDSEIFCNRIRLRAKRAMLGCIKKTLDELEKIQGQEVEGQGETAQVDPEFAPEGGETEEGQGQEVEDDETVYTCVHCGQSSYSKSEMGWHMKEAHGSDKQASEYYCTKCDKCFTKRYVYRLHMEMHEIVQQEDEEGEEAAKGKTTSSKASSPFKCQYCDLQFSGKSALLFHEASKHQTCPLFSCALCSKKFLTEEKREIHQSLCSGNRLECELCHKEYNVGSITQHMRTHRGEKPYLCAECGKTFSQKGDLKRHTKQIHMGLEPAKPFLCSYCPKTFSAQSKLKIHERSHTKEKPYSCDECGKGFAHLSTLRKHRENREFACLPVIEQAAKPYTCAICKKGWDQKYALTKHIEWVHEQKRPSRTFPCPYCSKVYYCRSQLTYHERTHTKEKPFVCGICDKSFTYNSVRKTHMAKEHGLKRSINDGPR